MPCNEIAEHMIQVVPAMTRLLDWLDSNKYVVRQRCTEDRRVVYVELTASAKKLLAKMDQPVLRPAQTIAWAFDASRTERTEPIAGEGP